MDSNITIKPRPAVVGRSNALRDPVTVREASDTALDPSKAVTPAADSGSKHESGQHHEQPQRDVTINPDARDALFHAVDIRTEHDDHSQNQVLMRQRAYQHPAAKPQSDDPTSDPHADIEA